ncbi:hypothetical protein Hanom_Chr16g01449671 [Helianthus anomalus]
MVKNFALPEDADMEAQPFADVGIGPETKNMKRGPIASIALKKTDMLKADVPKIEKKKGTRLASDSLCDYIVVSDSLEGLAPVALKEPKAEPRNTADIPESNADDPIDVESSPEPLVKTKAVKGKSLKVGAHEKEKHGSSVQTETISFFNDDRPPSPPPESVKENLEGVKTVEAEAENTVETEVETVDVGLKQGDTFSDWQVCRDWHQGAFPPTEIKFQEEQTHDRTYRAYLQETASSTSITHRIVGEWRSMYMLWDAVESSKNEIVEEKAKKTEEWSAMGWKKKVGAEVALLAEERKLWKEACEWDNNEKRTLRNEAPCLIEKEASKERYKLVQTKAELESAKKDLQLAKVEIAEAARRLTETEEKLESSQTAWVTAESLVEPLKNNMLWIQYHGIINCSQHVTNALKVNWDTSRSATSGVNTGAAHATAKEEYNHLHLPVTELVTDALQHENFVDRLKEVFPDEAGASDDEDLD